MSVLQIDRDSVRLAGLRPALGSFEDEARAFTIRFLAYVCGVASLAALIANVLVAPVGAAIETPPAAGIGRQVASRPQPGVADPRIDLSVLTEPYGVLRHPAGGRDDLLRWPPAANGTPASAIELRRPGREISRSACRGNAGTEPRPAECDLARRADGVAAIADGALRGSL